MNNVEAKKGFLSFIATVAIAAGIYFSAYFAVNALNSKAQDNQLSYKNKNADSLGRPDTTGSDEEAQATDSQRKDVEAPKEMAMADTTKQDVKVVEDFSDEGGNNAKAVPTSTPAPTPTPTAAPTATATPAASTTPVPEKLQASAQTSSVFGSLARADKAEDSAVLGTNTEKPAVLAGATKEATVGGTPTTGSSSMAAVVITGLSFVFYGIYLGSEKSRKAAIRAFEKRIRERI